ncbi:hypothetical protein [Allorhizocola rhizosphaerae]|uniref:hypothetical protein n=1 Tax=Allorhizocola rhizosphaerae TaxID=1872709 RepID=UPI000E3B7B83|nr:hypothetical protein [Allorhizocola rhizosphaerae]
MANGGHMFPDVEQARQRLQARLDELHQCTAELGRWAATYQQRAQEEDDERDRQELAEFARSADAPPELRSLQQQIERGELSWHGVLIGDADGVMDERVSAFLAGRLASLAALGEALRSGMSAEEAALAVRKPGR